MVTVFSLFSVANQITMALTETSIGKIFLECVRRAGHTPEIHDSDPTTLVMTCYHCGQRFSLLEADLQAGDLTENEVRSNISGARFI